MANKKTSNLKYKFIMFRQRIHARLPRFQGLMGKRGKFYQI